MIINCTYEKNKWKVEVRVLNVSGGFYDVMVSGRGISYHIIVGAHAYGYFVCIPSIGIGCELATLTDTFWNQESVSRYLSSTESATLVAAINHLPQLGAEDDWLKIKM
jgi:hypothetical protein